MINLVVADFLHIRTLHLRQLFVNPSVFYHPFQENHTADDTSRLFDIYDTSPLAHMSDAYPQAKSSW